jgi:subtilisin-like proprotein convertase family protein
MIKFWVSTICATALAVSANAAVYNTFTSSPGAYIPDANPSGYANSLSSTFGSGYWVTDVTVSLTISGGYNGDLYSYLTYTPSGGSPSGFAVLLNRVGRTSDNTFGYSAAGFNNITLNGAGGDIHAVQNPTASTTYGIDGRTANPATVVATDYRDANQLASFNGLNASGTWTIFFADMAGGDISKLDSWSVNITAVPEPVNVALAIVGGLGGLGLVARTLRRKSA